MKTLILLTALCIGLQGMGQMPVSRMLISADSVVLTHWEGQQDSIVQRRKLTMPEIAELIKVLDAKDTIGVYGKCFDPHHAVMMYHNKRSFSGIRICFSCIQYDNTPDIKVLRFDWIGMKRYFIGKGFTVANETIDSLGVFFKHRIKQ